MANIKFANNVRDHIADAVKKGAKPLIDTDAVFPNDKVTTRYLRVKQILTCLQTGTAYVSPQILVDVDHSMLVMKEEVKIIFFHAGK